MTQNTQTTAERIARLIDENYQIHGLRADYETAKIVARELDARQAQIDALTAERDEARRSLLVEREAYSKRAADQVADGAVKLMAEELAEAQAEVERLRPAAEAWEALQAAYQGLGSSLEYAYSLACVKRAARRRAAKVTP